MQAGPKTEFEIDMSSSIGHRSWHPPRQHAEKSGREAKKERKFRCSPQIGISKDSRSAITPRIEVHYAGVTQDPRPIFPNTKTEEMFSLHTTSSLFHPRKKTMTISTFAFRLPVLAFCLVGLAVSAAAVRLLWWTRMRSVSLTFTFQFCLRFSP